MVEPWLRGTLTEVDSVRRGVLHALELAREDVARWCGELTEEELEARPFGLPSVGFQMRHMVRSLDRLLTYAEGQQLSEEQLALLKSEMEGGGGLTPRFPSDSVLRGSWGTREDLFAEFERGVESAMRRVRAIGPARYEEARGVGRKMLPTSVGGLLVHCADHTQRHVGQAVTTAKVVRQAEGSAGMV
jgi:uncharacterized damage-inducible protein DinB